MDGGGLVEQGGRQAVLGPGDFALTDLSRPARWAMDARRVIAVVFPAGLLPLRPDQVRQVSAVAIPGDRGAGALVSALAARLTGHLGEYGPAEAARLGGAVLDLIGSALAGRLDTELPHRALASRVTAYIEANLADPDLSPAAVAAANHLSLRALHRLFEARESTVAAWIRGRRLERCRRDLADPQHDARPVSAIGARWGMPNPSHFSRAFRIRVRDHAAATREVRRDAADEVRGALGDGDRGRVRVAARRGGHDRRVHHPQAVDAAHPQVRVADRVGGAAHRAGAGRVEHRAQRRADPVPQPLLVVDQLAGHPVSVDHTGQRPAGGDLTDQPYAGHQRVEIGGGSQVVRVDPRSRHRVGAGQRDLAAAALIP